MMLCDILLALPGPGTSRKRSYKGSNVAEGAANGDSGKCARIPKGVLTRRLGRLPCSEHHVFV